MVDNNNLKFSRPLILQICARSFGHPHLLFIFPSRRILRGRHAKHGSFGKPEILREGLPYKETSDVCLRSFLGLLSVGGRALLVVMVVLGVVG